MISCKSIPEELLANDNNNKIIALLCAEALLGSLDALLESFAKVSRGMEPCSSCRLLNGYRVEMIVCQDV